MIKFLKITLVVLIVALILLTINMLVTILNPSNYQRIEAAKKDGRWEKFETCIEYHPSDYVCDSCWNAIILQKK
jgi:hypothetical protein